MSTTEQAPKPAPDPVAYYDNEAKTYWLDDSSGWISLSESGLARHLRAAGKSPRNHENRLISPIDDIIINIQRHRRIDYAGPLAGWPKGVYDSYGYRLLVTHSPKLLTPAEGDWPIWQACLESMYLAPHATQLPTLYSWYKVAVEGLYHRTFRPGQMKFAFGTNDSGKNFEQNKTTIILGGRVADPFRYMSGRTDFNRDLFGAEHLLIADPDINSIKDKLDFANRIKQFTVNEIQSCHGKNREAFSARPFWRVSASANSEVHNMGIITATDRSVLEKLLLLQVSDGAIPPAQCRDMGYDEFSRAVDKELPHFIWFLLHQWRIPAELGSRRFGVRAFHHPELLEEAKELSTEMRLEHTMVESAFFMHGLWEGSVTEIAGQLSVADGHEADKFARNVNLITYCLYRLREQFPDRYEQLPRKKNKRTWRIKPPSDLVVGR